MADTKVRSGGSGFQIGRDDDDSNASLPPLHHAFVAVHGLIRLRMMIDFSLEHEFLQSKLISSCGQVRMKAVLRLQPNKCSAALPYLRFICRATSIGAVPQSSG